MTSMRAEQYFSLLNKFDGWIPFPRPSKTRPAPAYMDLNEVLADDDEEEVLVETYSPRQDVKGYCKTCGRAFFSLADDKSHQYTHRNYEDTEAEEVETPRTEGRPVCEEIPRAVEILEVLIETETGSHTECREFAAIMADTSLFGRGKRTKQTRNYAHYK